MKHRIPYTDLHDALNPIAFILEVDAVDSGAAYSIAHGIADPTSGELPPEVRRVGLRFEESLPFFRAGYAIRRRSWKKQLVLRKTLEGQIITCERDIHDPKVRHEWDSPWTDGSIDIMTGEDWELVFIPGESRAAK